MWQHTATLPVSLRGFSGRPLPHDSGRRKRRADRGVTSARRPRWSTSTRASRLGDGPQPTVPPEQHELLRVLAVTDLHVDYDENMRWVEAIDGEQHRRDVLIVSGDVSDELASLEAALGALCSKFGAVFYCPGNHELWVRERDRAAGILDSLTKLRRIRELCARLGVHTQPRRLGGLWVAPLLSWHHRSWDCEPDIPGVPPASAWTVSDYSCCQWPHSVPGGDSNGGLALAEWFDGMNDTPAWRRLLAGRAGCDVISFSHFLPLQGLLPEKRYLYFPNLMKAVGSAPLAARLAQLRPDIHLFGHTHFSWDARLGPTRYIQAPLCSPWERQKRLHTVGFGASMAAAKEDPVGAPWLPLVVYQGLVPVGALERLKAETGEAEAGEAGQGDGAGLARVVLPTGSSISNGGSSNGGSSSRSSGAALPEQPQQLGLLAASVPGWRPLAHGAEAPPLHAHWSDHYSATPRSPDIVALAPWVEQRWRKRRSRAAARQRAGGVGGASSGGEGSGSEPEDSG